ncbi:MAG: hypothetical protein ACLTKG_05275 [Collinsella intestinalis]
MSVRDVIEATGGMVRSRRRSSWAAP